MKDIGVSLIIDLMEEPPLFDTNNTNLTLATFPYKHIKLNSLSALVRRGSKPYTINTAPGCWNGLGRGGSAAARKSGAAAAGGGAPPFLKTSAAAAAATAPGPNGGASCVYPPGAIAALLRSS